MSGWNSKKQFLSPSFAHFPKPINICILDFIRVRFLRENTLLTVSPLLFLNHLGFFIFFCFALFLDLILKN